jgi:hypothetical protein
MESTTWQRRHATPADVDAVLPVGSTLSVSVRVSRRGDGVIALERVEIDGPHADYRPHESAAVAADALGLFAAGGLT